MFLSFALFFSVWLSTFAVIAAIAVPFKITISMVLGFIVGLYELVVRLIPSVGNYSLVNKIIDILKWLSDFFNRKK
jgi:hypothetical protein